MSWQSTTLIIAGVVLLTTAWLGRYELVSVPVAGDGYGKVYRLDRWTGQVVHINFDEAEEVKFKK